jgi:hypothetical protein
VTKTEKNRTFLNSVLFIVAVMLPLFLTLTASAITGNRAAGLPILALWIILPFVALRRKQQSRLPNDGTMKWSLDRPFSYCVICGAIIGLVLSLLAEINLATPILDPKDTVTPVTSTYNVFGVAVAESTGPRSDNGRRLTQFESLVSLVFVIIGMITGFVVYIVGFRKRGLQIP